jgi:hypothetical protein
MASTYTSRLKLERQASGENSGTWGNFVNYVLNRIDSTVRGYVAVSVAGSANVTLVSNTSTTNTDDSTTDDQVHNKTIEFTGALTGDIHVFTDAVEGEYILFNNTTGSQSLTFANTGHAGNGVALAQGSKTIVFTTGTAVTDVFSDVVRDADIGVSVQGYDADLTAIGGLAKTDGNIIVGNGSTWIAENGATARTSLGVAIGSDVQAYDAQLADIAGLAVTDGNIIVGNGSNFVAESGATARTSLGVGTGSDVQFDSFGVGTAASGTTGEIRATNDVTAFYSSDVALKENIINIPNPLEAIQKLNGVLFDWKKSYIDQRGGEDGYFVRKRDVGVIAQEVEKVLPEAVGQRPDGIKAVKYDRLTCLLIEAVKQLQDKVDSLSNKGN